MFRLRDVPGNVFRIRTGIVPSVSSFRRLFVSCSSLPPTSLSYKTDHVKSEISNRMFFLGMGFVGEFFAKDLKKRGWDVTGTCTSISKKKKLEEIEFNVHIFDANEPEPEVLNILNKHTHLVVSVPPVPGIGDPILIHDQLVKSRFVNGNLQWLCYLSSTGVYGDCGGAWVTEDYPAMPINESAKARLVAEEGWLNLGSELSLSSQIFRLGGIYGPGRSAIDTLMKEEPLSKTQTMRSSRRYTSRVHVADISQALYASIQNPSSTKAIYNIVDDDPAPRDEVFEYARKLVENKLGTQIGKMLNAEECDLARTVNLRGEKRVSNRRMKVELGVSLIHPSYKSGLQSIIDSI